MLDKLKSVLWESDPVPNKGAASAAPPIPAVPMPQATQIPGATFSAMPTAPGLNQQMLDDITAVIARRSTAFSSLEDKIKTLRSSGLDEISATRAAAALLKSEGKSTDAIISSIDLHIRDIEAELQSFSSAGANAVKQRVDSLRAEAANLQNMTAQDEAQIKSLQEQIQALQTRIFERSTVISQKQVDANQAETDIQQKINQFTAAANSVTSSLASKKSTLASTLS